MDMTPDLQAAVATILNALKGADGVSDTAHFIKDFKGNRDGKPNDDAWLDVIASGARRVYVPEGNYRCDKSIRIPTQIEIYGDGADVTNFDSYVTNEDGMSVYGGSAVRLRDFSLNYKGPGQTAGFSGLRAQAKILADSIRVNRFTGTGIFCDSRDGTIGGAAFFSHWLNVWSKGNGVDGFAQRFGANGHLIQLCQFDKNKRRGYHHYTDGGATYNTLIQCSQACYNSDIGWMFENGTNITADALYAEFNGTPTNTNKDGYINTKLDYFVGNNCSRSRIGIGTVYNNDMSHVQAPAKGLNDSCGVYVGADRVWGSTLYHQVT